MEDELVNFFKEVTAVLKQFGERLDALEASLEKLKDRDMLVKQSPKTSQSIQRSMDEWGM